MSNTPVTGPFAAHELVPATGLPVARHTDAIIAKVASAIGTYDGIHVVTERHDLVTLHYKKVMAQSVSSGRPTLGGRVLGPTGSGKTTSARHFRSLIESQNDHAPGDKPIVIAPLDQACTSRRLFASILNSLGDDFAARATEEILKQRVYMALKRLNTRLLVIDEVQHLSYRSTVNNSTTDTLKRVLDDGICPMVLIGTDEATDFLNSNKQLANRLMPPADMRPLSATVPEDRKLFATYAHLLDKELVRTGLTTRLSGLADKRVLPALFQISSGVLGRVSNLVRAALDHALSRQAEFIEIHDLSAATTSWAIAQDFLHYNPFLVANSTKSNRG